MRIKRLLIASLYMMLLFAVAGYSFANFEFNQNWYQEFEQSTIVYEAGIYGDNIVLATTSGFIAYSKEGEKKWVYNYPDGSYTLGLPVIEDNIAVFVTYFGKEAKGTSENTDALLNAIDLTNGRTLWSAYLPQYLPLEYKIFDQNLYVSCQYINKPIKKKHVIKRWKSDKESRRDTWLMCIDVQNGRQKWYQQVDGWISAIGQSKRNVFTQEYGSTIDGAFTAISARNTNDGAVSWTSERFRDEITFLESVKQVDGEIFIGDNNLILINSENGETLRNINVKTGTYIIRNGLFWNITETEEGFLLQKIDLKDFSDIHEVKIQEPMKEFSTWINKKSFSKLLQSDFAYWIRHLNVNHDAKYSYFQMNVKKEDEKLILPVARKNTGIGRTYFLENYFLLNVFNGVETRQTLYMFNDTPEIIMDYSGEANQQPDVVFDLDSYSLLSAYDSLFLQINKQGDMNVISDKINGTVINLFLDKNNIIVVSGGGLYQFTCSMEQEAVEVVLEEEPEPAVLVPIPEPEPVVEVPVEPVYKEVEKEVDGYRIQIMYLTKTTLQKAQSYAKESEQKTGYPVYVVKEGAIKLRVGDFITETEARKALTQIKNVGFKDAYLVQSKVLIKEKIRIN